MGTDLPDSLKTKNTKNLDDAVRETENFLRGSTKDRDTRTFVLAMTSGPEDPKVYVSPFTPFRIRAISRNFAENICVVIPEVEDGFAGVSVVGHGITMVSLVLVSDTESITKIFELEMVSQEVFVLPFDIIRSESSVSVSPKLGFAIVYGPFSPRNFSITGRKIYVDTATRISFIENGSYTYVSNGYKVISSPRELSVTRIP